MKKWTSLLLVFLLCLPVFAVAETLTVDLSAATLDELLQAQRSIAMRILELRAREASYGSDIALTGDGTAIVSGVEIPFAPSRVVLETAGKFSATLSDELTDFDIKGTDYHAVFFGQTGTYTLLVASDNPWTFAVEPIEPGAELPMSGAGSYVSGFFEMPAPVILEVKGSLDKTKDSSSNFMVYVAHQSEYSEKWPQDLLVNEVLNAANLTYEKDIIVTPTPGRSQYCIVVRCTTGVDWSIRLK